MPSFITADLLLTIIIVGTLLAGALLLVAVLGRMVREIHGKRREVHQRRVRPLVLAVVAGEDTPAELITIRGAPGRAAERVSFSYLQQIRGDAHDRLAEVLEQRGVVDRLLRQARRAHRHRRTSAAGRLGLVGSPEAERRLSEMVSTDNSSEVRIVVTRALGKMGSATAARTLLHSLDRTDPVPEGIVAAALLELGPDAVPALREALDSKGAGGHRRQAMAAEVLGLLDEMPAWRALADNSAGGDLEVRVSAVQALGRLGVPQATVPVTACLAPDVDPALRATAARALGRIGDLGGAPALAACLDDPDYWVAHNAAEALARLGSTGLGLLGQAAAARRPAAGHAREALSRAALLQGEMPPAPADEAVSAPPAVPAAPLGAGQGGFRAGQAGVRAARGDME